MQSQNKLSLNYEIMKQSQFNVNTTWKWVVSFMLLVIFMRGESPCISWMGGLKPSSAGLYVIALLIASHFADQASLALRKPYRIINPHWGGGD
jgi:hypothetical protein